MTIVVMNLVTV